MSSFHIHVTKDYLVFCAGHFITYDGSQCETLHGHNYRAAVSLGGPVDENSYVFDFTRLKKLMKRVVDELDHRMLLPLHNPMLTLNEEEDGIWVRYKERRFFFPRPDFVLLPIPNTTAEMLARHLCGRIKEELAQLGAANLTEISVEVEESFGQSAIYREALPEPGKGTIYPAPTEKRET